MKEELKEADGRDCLTDIAIRISGHWGMDLIVTLCIIKYSVQLVFYIPSYLPFHKPQPIALILLRLTLFGPDCLEWSNDQLDDVLVVLINICGTSYDSCKRVSLARVTFLAAINSGCEFIISQYPSHK